MVVTAGSIPFLGLIVPNAVSLLLGDNMRRAIPWVAILGGVFVLACDIVGRLLIHPYEIPLGTVVGVVGSVCSCGCCTDGGIVMPEARSAIAAPRPSQAAAAPRPRRGGCGCWRPPPSPASRPS